MLTPRRNAEEPFPWQVAVFPAAGGHLLPGGRVFRKKGMRFRPRWRDYRGLKRFPASRLPSPPLQQDEHHEGEEEIHLLAWGHFTEFFDLEAAFPEGGLLGHTHRRGTAGAGGEEARVEDIAAEHAHDWDLAENRVQHLGPHVFLLDGEVGNVIAGIERFVVRLPDRAPAAAADAADLTAVCIRGKVAGGPVDDFVRLDLGEAGALGWVCPDFYVLAEFEQLLLGVEDDATGGIGDGGATGEGEDLEGKGERVLDALELAGEIIGRWDGGKRRRRVGVGNIHGWSIVHTFGKAKLAAASSFGVRKGQTRQFSAHQVLIRLSI